MGASFLIPNKKAVPDTLKEMHLHFPLKPQILKGKMQARKCGDPIKFHTKCGHCQSKLWAKAADFCLHTNQFECLNDLMDFLRDHRINDWYSR